MGPQTAAAESLRGTPVHLSNRDRFIKACHCEPVGRPPIWLMRQAGRALPEYRELKERHTFLEMVQTPELAAEVTLQPIRRFGFDAAILFSDILVIAEGLGQKYQFRDRGIEMEFLLNTETDIAKLDVGAVNGRLEYVAMALRLIKKELQGQTALIGFAGAPWTLANFMVEGGGIADYSRAKGLFFSNRRLYDLLMEKLAMAVSGYLQMQIEAGAEAVQIFDSHAGLLSDQDFWPASGIWIQRIVESLKGRVPVIVFAKGAHGSWNHLSNIGANILGVDWNVNLADVRRRLPPKMGVQGNLDPFLLTTNPEAVTAAALEILNEMRGMNGHIFNLGHGVTPAAKLENIQALVDAVRNFQ
jgi:uroporphyrinogen decarboxylase